MYDNEPTFDDLAELAAIEDMHLVRAHSQTFWDADVAELVSVDPFEHPSWDVADALTEDGWDDPATAIEVRELLADDVRLVPLAHTPTARPRPHSIDEVLVDEPVGEEAFHEWVLALVPIATDGSWPADDTGWEVRAA